MSGILGLFNADGRPIERSLLRPLLGRMAARGRDRAEVWSMDGAALGVARYEWELQDDFSGNVMVADERDLAVAADASLYYRKELREKVGTRGVRIGGTTASHLILAAYRAWGDQCVEHLEGDYAFVLYDRLRRRVFCARDFGGRRPLYYAELDNGVILGSTMSALIVHPDCSDDLNIAYLAETAASLWPSVHETAYESVSSLPAGWSLAWSSETRVRLQQQWYAPESESAEGPPFEDAAAGLRELLCRAVAERLGRSGVTAVWLSGGWDSTAVFGAGQQVVGDRRDSQPLRAVSISYPPGDPGREDELISAVAERWQAPVHWLDIRDIPLIDNPAERAAARDEPGAHAFELWNRSLARGSRSVAARVAFDGNGGDQLFQVSPAFLTDLLRTGRWVTLLQEWRALKLHGFKDFFQWALKPALPPSLLDVATMIRGGRRLHGVYERRMPTWMDPRLVSALAERQRAHLPPRRGRSCSAYETHLYLSCAFFPRMFAAVAGFALEEGVELRSPLYDHRVIGLAARRPWWERCSTGETKRLLRRAMSGLVPERVLARRRYRTGVTSAYFARETCRNYPELFRSAEKPWASAELGIVDYGRLARASRDYIDNPDLDVGHALWCTLHVELWLRARLRPDTKAAEDGTRDSALAAGPVLAGGEDHNR